MSDQNSIIKKLKKYHPKVLRKRSIISIKSGKVWDTEILLEHLDFEDLMFDKQEWKLKEYSGKYCLEYKNTVCWRKDQLKSWTE